MHSLIDWIAGQESGPETCDEVLKPGAQSMHFQCGGEESNQYFFFALSALFFRHKFGLKVNRMAMGRVERKPDPQQNWFGCKIKSTPGLTGEFLNPNPNLTGFGCLSGLYMGQLITPESHKSDFRPNTTTPDSLAIDNMKLKLVTSVTTVHKSGMIDLTTSVPIRQTKSETSYIEA
jgi:hypothetical protein